MKNVKSVLAIGCSLLIFASCNKEDLSNTQNADQKIQTRAADDAADYGRLDRYFASVEEFPRGDESAEFYAAMEERRKQIFRVNANEPVRIVGEQGTVLTCPENNFLTPDGGTLEGDVEIELIEVFNKADMIMLDKATNGITEDGDAITALISGGELFVRATQGGTQVELAGPMRVEVITDVPDTDMGKFVEVDGTGDELLWEAGDDKDDMEVREGGGEGDYVTAYDILPGEWGWTNIDKWAGDPCSKTDIFVQVPAGHDPSNTEVYLSYDGDPGRLANFDIWDGTQFTEHYGQICIGLDCHFVAVTNVGGSLEYAIQGATITPGHVEVISSFTPISEAALITLINGLP